MEQVGDRQRMPMPEADTARYVTMGLRQTMGEQGYPTGVAGVAEERGRCSAERSCCRPQARRCLSHFTVGHKRVMLQARWRLSPMWALGKDGDHGGRTGRGPDAGWESDACGERVGWRMVAHDVPPSTIDHFAKFQSGGGRCV